MSPVVSSRLPWLVPTLASLEARLARGQPPQALLVYGPAGTGRHELVEGIAQRLLGKVAVAPPADRAAPGGPAHPDLLTVSPEPERQVIAVSQIRDLIYFTGLTSHGGGRKVAILTPAEALNPAAANSLLKTLEEPPGPTTIILVGQSLARLPATVVSRCERVRVTVPATEVALAWLREQSAGEPWERLLAFAGGAPLRALDLALAGEGGILSRLTADLERLQRREETPLATARQWVGLDGDLCLRWLYWAVAGIVRGGLVGGPGGYGDLTIGKPPLPNPSEPLNIRHCYEYLDRLQQARRLLDRGLNLELQLADLLMWWFGGPGRMHQTQG